MAQRCLARGSKRARLSTGGRPRRCRNSWALRPGAAQQRPHPPRAGGTGRGERAPASGARAVTVTVLRSAGLSLQGVAPPQLPIPLRFLAVPIGLAFLVCAYRPRRLYLQPSAIPLDSFGFGLAVVNLGELPGARESSHCSPPEPPAEHQSNLGRLLCAVNYINRARQVLAPVLRREHFVLRSDSGTRGVTVYWITGFAWCPSATDLETGPARSAPK